MPFAFIQDVPANAEMYGKIRAELGDAPPEGLIAHIVQELDAGGLRYTDVWASRELWDTFRNVTLEPVVTGVLAGYGIPHNDEDISVEEITVLDAWIGA